MATELASETSCFCKRSDDRHSP